MSVTWAEIQLTHNVDEIDERLGELADEIGWLEARRWELDEARGNPELRELRSDYRASIL
jgi:hypothetical protein